MERVAIVGSGGAGKTTLAAEMGRRTLLPVVHLDRLHWKPGWVETSTEEWASTVAEQAARPRWIIDGNYAGTYELRFERADTIIVVSLPRVQCLLRALQRVTKAHGRAIQAEGCPERYDLHYLRWIWQYPSKSRPALDEALARAARHAIVIELRSKADVAAFLEGLPR